MNALNRKLVRELWRLRGQLVAITLVVACGVAVYVTMATNLAILQGSRDSYYDRHRFGDLFATISQGPQTVSARIEEIPGVAQVETRINQWATVYVEGFNEPVTGRLVSLPPEGKERLNTIYLRKGRHPNPRARDEVLVLESFASAHGLELGEPLRVLLNGRYETMKMVGVTMSPEYVFAINPGGMPDPKRAGVFWVPEETIAAAYDLQGSFNHVSVTLLPGTDEQKVIDAIDLVLEPYGGQGAHGRDLHPSDRQLMLELEQLESQGIIVPTIFLAVAAFLLNVVLSRLIGTQREQIAALKAVGYSNWAVGMHYARLVLLVVIGGVVIGSGVGLWLGQGMAQLYTKFFSFPSLDFRIDWAVMVTAAILTAAAAGLGTQRAVRSVVSLPPAEAMRPPAPQMQRQGLLEILGLGELLDMAGRMALRGITARPGRSLMTVIGVGFAISILVVGNFSGDAMDYLMKVHFRMAMRDEINVGFTKPLPSGALRELEHIDGVRYAEGFRSVPVRLHHGRHSHELGLTGVQPDGDLRRAITEDLDIVPVPEHGVMLTDYLAKMLHLEVGDEITVEVLEGDRRTRRVPVVATLHENFGVNAYMSLENVNALLGEPPVVNAALLEVEKGRVSLVFDELQAKPNVAMINRSDAMFASFEEMSGEMMATMRMIFIIFASIIAVGVVYNSARISFSERSRELASLRVMGFSRMEVSTVLLSELAVLMLISVPVGWAIGWTFVYLVIQQATSELYRFPVLVQDETYAMSAIVVLSAGVVAALLVRRRVDHLDMMAVLKTKD